MFSERKEHEHKEKVANIDVVNILDEKTVLLTHTDYEFSVGVIRLPNNSAVVAWLLTKKDFSNYMDNKLSVARMSFNISFEAISFAEIIINKWIGTDPEPTISEFVKDPPFNEPQIKDLGSDERLPIKEEVRRQELMARIRDNGAQIPIIDIIKRS